MSAWRLALRRLHEAGGTLPACRISLADHERRELLRRGLAELHLDGRRHVYSITALGRDVATGRRTLKPPCYTDAAHRTWRWAATWLAALPYAGEIRFHGTRPARLEDLR
jgi:hypothetical protein